MLRRPFSRAEAAGLSGGAQSGYAARVSAARRESRAPRTRAPRCSRSRLAAIDYTEGRASEAHVILDELLKREPHSRIGLLLKARLLLLEKKVDEALNMAKGAVAADPERAADAYLVVAQSYFAKGQIEDAQDAIKQVLKLDA